MVLVALLLTLSAWTACGRVEDPAPSTRTAPPPTHAPTLAPTPEPTPETLGNPGHVARELIILHTVDVRGEIDPCG